MLNLVTLKSLLDWIQHSAFTSMGLIVDFKILCVNKIKGFISVWKQRFNGRFVDMDLTFHACFSSFGSFELILFTIFVCHNISSFVFPIFLVNEIAEVDIAMAEGYFLLIDPFPPFQYVLYAIYRGMLQFLAFNIGFHYLVIWTQLLIIWNSRDLRKGRQKFKELK